MASTFFPIAKTLWSSLTDISRCAKVCFDDEAGTHASVGREPEANVGYLCPCCIGPRSIISYRRYTLRHMDDRG